MELLLKKFYFIYNNKNSLMTNLLEIKDKMLNYINLTYTLILYLLKLAIVRILILSKKLIPFIIKYKIKQIIFYNEKLWKFIVHIKKWLIGPPSIYKVRQINNIFLNFVSLFFIPLFTLILKKENWEILMKEKLKNNVKLKEKLNNFTNKTNQSEISENENIFFKINVESFTKNEMDIFDKFNKALFSNKIHHI